MTEVAGLYRPAGSLAADGWSVVLTPESAGWAFAGLRVVDWMAVLIVAFALLGIAQRLAVAAKLERSQ